MLKVDPEVVAAYRKGAPETRLVRASVGVLLSAEEWASLGVVTRRLWLGVLAARKQKPVDVDAERLEELFAAALEVFGTVAFLRELDSSDGSESGRGRLSEWARVAADNLERIGDGLIQAVKLQVAERDDGKGGSEG